MTTATTTRGSHDAPVHGPAFVKTLFNDTRLGWLWLPFRLYAGYLWLEAASHKIFDPKWVQSGEALQTFWQKALQVDPKPVIEVGWYRDFIQYLLNSGSYLWFAKVVAYGELIVGVLLIIGAFTGLAALGGAIMNWNYVMAGSASINGVLLAIELFLILAWKTAGWIGLDRWILTYFGVPWSPGRLFQPRSTSPLNSPPMTRREIM